MTQHYIFGYGSLISDESRAKTGESGVGIPVRVKGIQRQWSLVVPDARLTGAGAIYDDSSSCNGVIVSVSEDELPKFDNRETPHGYKRVEIDRQNIVSLVDKNIPKGIVWTYLAHNPGIPSSDNPIIQSYIDVILTGCFRIGDSFAREFIVTTQGWNNPWINDRANPRYPRAMTEVLLADKIDKLLEELVPDAFRKRRLI